MTDFKDRIYNRIEESLNEKLADLESRSRKICELVVKEKFIVNEVIAESYSTSFIPRSEMMIGGRSSKYKGGLLQSLFWKFYRITLVF